MNWDAIGSVAEIIGAFAVIVTLVYLARQIGQNVGASSASLNRSLQESFEGLNELIITNPALITALEALRKTSGGKADDTLVVHFAARWMNIWRSAEFAYRNAQITLPEFTFYKDDFRAVANAYPGFVSCFVQTLRLYSGAKEMEIFAPIHDQL